MTEREQQHAPTRAHINPPALECSVALCTVARSLRERERETSVWSAACHEFVARACATLVCVGRRVSVSVRDLGSTTCGFVSKNEPTLTHRTAQTRHSLMARSKALSRGLWNIPAPTHSHPRLCVREHISRRRQIRMRQCPHKILPQLRLRCPSS